MNGNIATILGIKINGTKLAEVLNIVVGAVNDGEGGLWDVSCGSGMSCEGEAQRKKRLIIFTPNPEFIVESQSDSEFKKLLNQADINIPDGIGLVWAGKLLGQPIKERVSGADVVERLLETGNSHEKWTVGIAGARRGIKNEAEELIKRLVSKYPNIEFVNLDSVIPTKSQYTSGRVEESLSSAIEKGSLDSARDDNTYVGCKFNIVFAAHGMKKQEKWIWENKDRIFSNVFMGVGGSLDFLTGFSKRAPLFIRFVGLEWLWRGLQNPKHFKRIWKAVFVFGWLVIKEKLSKKTI